MGVPVPAHTHTRTLWGVGVEQVGAGVVEQVHVGTREYGVGKMFF
jgi:hypothetical protein